MRDRAGDRACLCVIAVMERERAMKKAPAPKVRLSSCRGALIVGTTLLLGGLLLLRREGSGPMPSRGERGSTRVSPTTWPLQRLPPSEEQALRAGGRVPGARVPGPNLPEGLVLLIERPSDPPPRSDPSKWGAR